MWIRCTALFKSREVEEILWETMSAEEQDENCEPREFRFDTDELFAFNEAKNTGITLRFKSGYDITVTMTVQELDAVIFKINS